MVALCVWGGQTNNKINKQLNIQNNNHNNNAPLLAYTSYTDEWWIPCLLKANTFIITTIIIDIINTITNFIFNNNKYINL